MFLKRFVTSSVRNQLIAGFLVVIVAFAIAISGVSSVSTTIRKGDGAAKLADEVSSSARNMAGSQLLVALSGYSEIANTKEMSRASRRFTSS
jgi:hypothetical protein